MKRHKYSPMDQSTTPVINPLHESQSPLYSSAYAESFRKARSSRNGLEKEDIYELNTERHDYYYGWKTILAASLLLITGLVLFIIGSVLYWNRYNNVSQVNTGFDMLLAGMLVLGI